jgi:hypothetical protein
LGDATAEMSYARLPGGGGGREKERRAEVEFERMAPVAAVTAGVERSDAATAASFAPATLTPKKMTKPNRGAGSRGRNGSSPGQGPASLKGGAEQNEELEEESEDESEDEPATAPEPPRGRSQSSMALVARRASLFAQDLREEPANATKRKERQVDHNEEPAPAWFEHRYIALLHEPRVYRTAYALLGAAPFLTSAGSALELLNGCPTISPTVEGLFALGTLGFASVWIFLFHGLLDVTRGVEGIKETLKLKGEALDKAVEAGEKTGKGGMTPRQRYKSAQLLAEQLDKQIADPTGEASDGEATDSSPRERLDSKAAVRLMQVHQVSEDAEAVGERVFLRSREGTSDRWAKAVRFAGLTSKVVSNFESAAREAAEKANESMKDAKDEVQTERVSEAFIRSYNYRTVGSPEPVSPAGDEDEDKDEENPEDVKKKPEAEDVVFHTGGALTRLSFDGGLMLDRVMINPKQQRRLKRWRQISVIIFICLASAVRVSRCIISSYTVASQARHWCRLGCCAVHAACIS